MQCKDIPDDFVVLLALQWRQKRLLPVVDALMTWGIPSKLAYTKVQRLVDRGFLEYGVSPRAAWPTDKGMDLLSTSQYATLPGTQCELR